MLYVGGISDLGAETIREAIRGPIESDLLLAQCEQVGVRSLSIVAITSLFIGMVLALQTAYSLEQFGVKLFIGKVVSLSLVRELAPVIMSFMVGGRAGAGIAAELGTMKVTEQIDALRAMAIHPVRYLVVPRVVAAVIMLPIITIFSDAIAIFGGYVVAITSIGVSS